MKVMPDFRIDTSLGSTSAGVSPATKVSAMPRRLRSICPTAVRAISPVPSPIVLRPSCIHAGASLPGCEKYSCRCRAICSAFCSTGKTSTNRNIWILKASSFIDHSIIFPDQKSLLKTEGDCFSMPVKIWRPSASMRASSASLMDSLE